MTQSSAHVDSHSVQSHSSSHQTSTRLRQCPWQNMLFHETTPLPCFHDLAPRKASTPTSLSLLAGGCFLPRRGPTARSPTLAFPPNGKRRLAVYHSFKTFLPPSINPPPLLLCCLGEIQEPRDYYYHYTTHTAASLLQTTEKHQPGTDSKNRTRNEHQISSQTGTR